VTHSIFSIPSATWNITTDIFTFNIEIHKEFFTTPSRSFFTLYPRISIRHFTVTPDLQYLVDNSRQALRRSSPSGYIDEVLAKSGVTVKVTNKISWDTEVEDDLDGVEKLFVYLDVECEYVSGDIHVAEE